MEWAVLGLVVIGLILTYVIFQETRAHRHWRGLVAAGNVEAIRALLEQEFERWRTMRVPKGVAPAVWHSVQTVQLVAVGADAAQVSCLAEGEYRVSDGRLHEVGNTLEVAMRVAAKLAELILYDVPNVRLSFVRVDVYTPVHVRNGDRAHGCILSLVADRATADDLDWEALRPHEIVSRFEHRYELNERGVALPFDPGPPLEGTRPVPAPDEGQPVRGEAE